MTPLAIRAASVVLGVAVAVWISGAIGVICGTGTTVVCLVVIARAEPRSARRHRVLLQQQQAHTAELLAACLSGGATVEAAVAAVSAASPEPMRTELDYVRRALALGARDPWMRLRPSALAQAMDRSRESGAPLAEVLTWLAIEARRDARAMCEQAARAAGVRAVAPLAACFLPSFLLIAVVPLVASLAEQMWA